MQQKGRPLLGDRVDVRGLRDEVDSEVNARMGEFRSQVQTLLSSDPLLTQLAAQPSTQQHARQRAEELLATVHAHDQDRKMMALQSNLQLLERENADLRSQLDSAQQTAADAQRARESGAAAAERSAHQETMALRELESLRAKHGVQQAALQSALAEKLAAEKASALLEAKLASAATSNVVRVKELEASKHALSAALDERTRQLQALQSQHDAQSRELESTRRGARDLESRLAAELTEAKLQAGRLRLELENASSTASELARKVMASEDANHRLKEASGKLRADLNEAESLLRRSERDRMELRSQLAELREQSEALICEGELAKEAMHEESVAAKQAVGEAIRDLETLSAERAELRLKLQEVMRQLEEETKAKSRAVKRLERREESTREELDALRSELDARRVDAEQLQLRCKEAVNKRDAHLAAAEAQVMALRSQLAQLEDERKALADKLVTKEKELEKSFDERLHLELRQQQLRYDRRLSELDLENRYRLTASPHESVQADLVRRILLDRNDPPPQLTDQSIRDVVSSQIKNAMQELSHRDEHNQVLELKLDALRHALTAEHEKKLHEMHTVHEAQRHAAQAECDAKLRALQSEAEAAARVAREHEASLKEQLAQAQRDLRDAKQHAEEEHHKLMQENANVMQENVNLLNRLDEVMADVHLLSQDNHHYRQQVENAEAVERDKADMEVKLVNLQNTASQKDKAAVAASHREAAAANQVQELMLRYQGALQELQAANAATAAAHAAAQTNERQSGQLQQQLALSEARCSELDEVSKQLHDELIAHRHMQAEADLQLSLVREERDRLRADLGAVRLGTAHDQEASSQLQRDTQQAARDKLQRLQRAVQSKLFAYRSWALGVSSDVQAQLAAAQADQARALKRGLQQWQQAAARQLERSKSEAGQSAVAADQQLAEAHHALAAANQQIDELKAQKERIKDELEHISLLSGDNAQLRQQLQAARATSRESDDLVGEVKSQHQHALRTADKLQQDNDRLQEEREELLKRLAVLEEIFAENERRFGAILRLLMLEAAVAEPLLAGLSDADAAVFDHALDQVKAQIAVEIDRRANAAVENVEMRDVEALSQKVQLLEAQLQDRDRELAEVHHELERRCTSFTYQLQSARSECTAAVEEHVSTTLHRLNQRVDDLQEVVEDWKRQFEQELNELMDTANVELSKQQLAAHEIIQELEQRMHRLQAELRVQLEGKQSLSRRLEEFDSIAAGSERATGQQQRRMERQQITIQSLKEQLEELQLAGKERPDDTLPATESAPST